MKMKPNGHHVSDIKKFGLAAVAVWTVFIVGMLVWRFNAERSNIFEQAKVEARAIWSHNLSYRKWVTAMGGVYVSAERMKPNPYLKVRDRDKKTTDGIDLTMANPAYMTGQVFDIIRKESDPPIINRIVSDKYLNPANKPDEWERKGLSAFEGGAKEVSELSRIEGKHYMRLFKPMTTVEGCLKCHGEQGYKVGDIRGGISVAVPMAPYYKIESVAKRNTTIIYLLIWSVGAGVIVFFNVRIDKKQMLIMESEEKYRALIECANDSVFIHEIKKDGMPGPFIEVNELACRQLGYSREELTSLSPLELDDPHYRDRVATAMERLLKEGHAIFETAQMTKDGRSMPVEVSTRVLDLKGKRLLFSLVRDITERKRSEEALQRLNRELRAISNCNQVLVRAQDEQTLLNDICRIVCDDAGYRMAWVGYAENDDARTVQPVVWAGVEDGYLADAKITWADTERGRGPCGTALRTGSPDCIQDFATEQKAEPWREKAMQRGCRSSISLPLKDEGGNRFGVLNIYAAEPNVFTSDEIRLLEELSDDLAFGIMALRARIERKQAEEALHHQAFELEQEVAERQVAQESLQEQALELENEIEERRNAQRELEILNDELEQRVKQRTAELEQKNGELERMNKIFVGRELRMVELKERIKELEKDISG